MLLRPDFCAYARGDSGDEPESVRFRHGPDRKSKRGKKGGRQECGCPVVKSTSPQGRNYSVDVALFGPLDVMDGETMDQYRQTVGSTFVEGFLFFCPTAEFEILEVAIESQMIQNLEEDETSKPWNRALQRRRVIVDTRISIGLNTPPPDFDVARIINNALSDTGRSLRRTRKLVRSKKSSDENQENGCSYDEFISALRTTYNNSYWDMVDNVDVLITEESFFSYVFPLD